MTIRVGVIGCGMISLYHLIAWRRIQGVELAALCDPDLDKARARAAEFGVPKTYSSAESMMESERLDAIDVASPREYHALHVRLAAARGIPVLCQKPLTPSYEESVELAGEVAGRHRLMVHENWRFRPYYRKVKEWLCEGRIGALRGATMKMRGSGFRPDASGRYPALERQPFMRDLPQLLVSEAMIHQLDVLRWLAGPVTVRYAALARVCPEIRGEDRALISMEAASGAPVLLDADAAAAGYPSRVADDLELLGTIGTIRFRDMTLSMASESAPEELSYDFDKTYQASFDGCIGHFVEALRTGRRFETDPTDNLETLRIVDDVYRVAGPIRNVVERAYAESQG